MTAALASERRWMRAAQLVALGALTVYAAFRARYVGGCDGASYILESYRLRGLEVGLGLDPSVPFPRALAPLCLVERHGELVTFFPPGYPVLLALGGLVGLEFHVNALLAAGSGLALYSLVRERAGAAAGLGLMTAWLASPLAVWGSTMLMSDMPSAALLVLALFSLRRGWPGLAGALSGLAMGVRPSNALALPALVLLCRDRRDGVRAALGFVTLSAGWAAYLSASAGGIFLPYTGNAALLTGEHHERQLAFLLRETATQATPVVALALVGMVARPRVTAPYVLWYGAFVLLSSRWNTPFEAWWQARFLLPGFPALFLCAAEGAAVLLAASSRASIAKAVGLGAAGLYAIWGTVFSAASPHLRTTTWDRHYEADSRRAARLVPGDALIGTVNYGSPLRLYAGLQTFFWCHADTPALLSWALAQGRPLFAILDNEERRCIRPGAPTLDWTEVSRLPSGRSLYRLNRPPVERLVDVGTAAARPFLLQGWSGDERDGDLTYAWVVEQRATLQLPNVVTPGNVIARIRLKPYEVPGPRQVVDASVDGTVLGRATLHGGEQDVDVRIPARLAGGILELRFGHAVSPKSLGASEDARTLAAAVDRVELLPGP